MLRFPTRAGAAFRKKGFIEPARRSRPQGVAVRKNEFIYLYICVYMTVAENSFFSNASRTFFHLGIYLVKP